MAWQAEQSERCQGCGHRQGESMDADAEGGYQAAPVRCHACAERDRASRKFADGGGDMAGLYFTIDRQF